MPRTLKITVIFFSCLLFLCCVGIIAWYAYIDTFASDRMTVTTVNPSILQKADGTSKYIIEVNYKTNANKNGLETFDINLNYFTDETRENIYSHGVQYVSNSINNKIEWITFDKYEEFLNNEFEINKGNLSQILEDEKFVEVYNYINNAQTTYTLKNTGKWIFNNPYKATYVKPILNIIDSSRYEYQSLEGQDYTGATNIITKDSLFTLSLPNENSEEVELIYMQFKGDNYLSWKNFEEKSDVFINDENKIGQSGRTNYYNNYSIDWLAYTLYENINKELPLGTNGTYTFEFADDVFRFFKVNEDNSVGDEILSEDRDLVINRIKTYFTIKINISADGAKNSKDSIFGLLHGSTNYSVDGSTSEAGNYFQGKQIVNVDLYDFTLVNITENYYAIKLNDKFLQQYLPYSKQIYLSINIDRNIFTNNNLIYAGLTKDCGLDNFKIISSNISLYKEVA